MSNMREVKERPIKLNCEPKRPIQGNWHYAGRHGHAFVWDHLLGVRAISAVEVVRETEGMPAIPNWHISVSRLGVRCSQEEARAVLTDFDARDFEEDNHDPKHVARHFWLQCNPADRRPCPCRDSEEPVDDKGYIWRKRPEAGP